MKLLKFPLPYSIYCDNSHNWINWQQISHIINTKLKNIHNGIIVAYARISKSHALPSPTPQTLKVTPLIKEKPSSFRSLILDTYSSFNKTQLLAGKIILCIGGRASLYADYQKLVEIAGGHFIGYRGTDLKSDQLNKLLDQANMVICPVDCISHEDFFLVKNYCALTGKICTFLARSTLPNFQQGLKTLTNLSRNSLGTVRP